MEEKRMEGDWNCNECNEVNFARRVSCYRCHAERAGYESSRDKMKPGDWLCRNCKAHNFARRNSCYSCHAQNQYRKLQHPRMDGQWECPDCKTLNFAHRTQCFSCKKIKNPISPKADVLEDDKDPQTEPQPPAEHPGSLEQPLDPEREPLGVVEPEHDNAEEGKEQRTQPKMLEGDWICSECNELNFARRNACYGCFASRNDKSSPGRMRGGRIGRGGRSGRGRTGGFNRDVKPGDWICAECNKNNFAFRSRCFSCNAAKSAYKGLPKTPMPMQPGDWMCPSCKTHNFARRTRCLACSSPKIDQ